MVSSHYNYQYSKQFTMVKLDIPQQFIDSYTPGYSSDCCYLDLYSEVETIVRPEPKDETELTAYQESVVQLMIDREDKGQVHLMIRTASAVQLLFGKQGGMCLTMGISDYSDFTTSHLGLGNLVHTYQDGDDTYLTLVHRNIAKQLKGVAEKIFDMNLEYPPSSVYLRISSKSGAKSLITNQTPSQSDMVKYINLKDVESVTTNDQLQGFQLETKIQIPPDVDISELESTIQQSAKEADIVAEIQVSNEY